MNHSPHRASDVPGEEARIQKLLSSLPDPGPMPDDLVERIAARLEAEQHTRAQAGATVVPFPVSERRRPPSRRFVMALGGAAAAAAVVGVVAVQAAHVPAGSLIAALSSRSGASGQVHTNVSATKYTSDGLPAQATRLVSAATTQPPLPTLSAESPMTGPLGTESGVRACLGSLHLSGPAFVDLAFFDGRPAAVLVTGETGHQQVRVVPRECGNGADTVLYGPVDLR